VAHQLLDDFLLFELQLAHVPEHFLLSLHLLVGFLFVEDFPLLLHVAVLLLHARLRLVLLLHDRLEQLVAVQLLQALRHLDVVLEALLVGYLGLVLLVVEDLLADDELLVEPFHLLRELLVLQLDQFVLNLLGASRHRVHLRVRILRQLHLVFQVFLVGVDRGLLLQLKPSNHVLHLLLMISIAF